MNESIISLRGLNKCYNPGKRNEVRVLNGVDLDIYKKEIVGLVAPSGAGKSTLLFIAGLIDAPDSGEILIDGKLLTNAKESIKTKIRCQSIGLVYQFHHLLTEFSAIENVMLPMMANRCSRRIARRSAALLLDSVGMKDRHLHRPFSLSGGEQQRVAICRALANSPKIILADEPTGNLDKEMSQQVFDLIIHRVRKMGSSALIATHNLDLANQMDRIVHLEQGQIY